MNEFSCAHGSDRYEACNDENSELWKKLLTKFQFLKQKNRIKVWKGEASEQGSQHEAECSVAKCVVLG